MKVVLVVQWWWWWWWCWGWEVHRTGNLPEMVEHVEGMEGVDGVEDLAPFAFVELVVDATVVDFVAMTVGWWKLDGVDLVVSFLALVLVLVE